MFLELITTCDTEMTCLVLMSDLFQQSYTNNFQIIKRNTKIIINAPLATSLNAFSSTIGIQKQVSIVIFLKISIMQWNL